MRLSTCFSYVLIAAALLFIWLGLLAIGWEEPGEAGRLGTGMLLAAATFTFALVFLLRHSSRSTQGVMMLVVLMLIIAFISRMLALSFNPDLYGFRRMAPLDTNEFARALMFMSACVLAFWAGLQVMSSGRNGDRQEGYTLPRGGLLYRHRWGILIAAYIVLLGHLLLGILAREGISGVPAGVNGYLLRLLPATGVMVMCMFILVRYSQKLTPWEKGALWSVFALAIVLGLVQGSRGALIGPVLSWVIVSIALKGDPRLSLKHIVVVGTAVLLTFFVIFPLATAIRDFNLRKDQGAEVSLVSYNFQVYVSRGPAYALEKISNRLNEFDKTLVVTNYSPPGLAGQLSPGNLLLAMVNNLSVDRILSFDSNTSASLFAIHYEGVPPTLQHGSNWSGFGMVFGLFRWYGILVYLAAGLVIGAILARWSRPWLDISGFVRVMFLFGISSIFLTGSFDTVVPERITETVLAIALLAGLETLAKKRASTTGVQPAIGGPSYYPTAD